MSCRISVVVILMGSCRRAASVTCPRPACGRKLSPAPSAPDHINVLKLNLALDALAGR
ncbi:hypothetical protein [Hymenobacter antarcticus]|uniref:hypothetical protein n=1 Tax=Hymenobacter antarcticus TaxID=486270 RepID=UPI0031E52F7E